MKKDWDDVLSVLKHSRHDWLNMVQLIKGNLALKKIRPYRGNHSRNCDQNSTGE
ncbi:MAG: Spo0B domain-containing protein [Bacillaceae bacterium]|nr:Spo0B domain-containing protein [Bacillaceae bacterium]